MEDKGPSSVDEHIPEYVFINDITGREAFPCMY